MLRNGVRQQATNHEPLTMNIERPTSKASRRGRYQRHPNPPLTTPDPSQEGSRVECGSDPRKRPTSNVQQWNIQHMRPEGRGPVSIVVGALYTEVME